VGTKAAQLATLKEQRAVQLRLLRYSYEQIAASILACPDHRPDGDRLCIDSGRDVHCVLLYPSGRSAARKAVERALARDYPQTGEGREQLRSEQLGQVDLLLQRTLRAAMSGDWEAARVATRLLDRRAKLLGLDAPTRVQITSELDSRIEELMEQMDEESRALAKAEQ
jgi:hypothetical protein